jgi:hypothetical protein
MGAFGANVPIMSSCLVRIISAEYFRRIFEYYREDHTHLGLDKETPKKRPISNRAAPLSKVIELPRVGGLHHRYEWSEAA